MRTLQHGQQVPELDQSITLTVTTRCPQKYILIDLETGESYTGHSTQGQPSWRRLSATLTEGAEPEEVTIQE